MAYKKFTAAQRKAYWANKGKEDDERLAKAQANFKPLQNPSVFQVDIFKDIASGVGHTVVNAVAGAGKSTTILNSLTYIPPGLKVCFCAFGRDPADELKERCPVAGIDVDTTHALGGRAIKRRWKHARLDKWKLQNIAIMQLGNPAADPDPEKFDEALDEKIRQVCKAVSLSKQCLAHDTAAVSDLLDDFNLEFLTEEERGEKPDAEKLEMLRNDFIAIVLKVQQQSKNDCFTYDFDDMIWFPIVHKLTMDQFDMLLIDETQDFNRCQMKLVLMMLLPGGRIIAVGDRRQAIYIFRGADQHSMDNLVTELNAKERPLSVTYRCSKKIVAYVKGIVAGLDHLLAADDSPDGEVNLEVTFDTMLEKAKPGDFIISRLNAPNVGLAMYLLAHNKPCNIRGKDLGDYFKYFIKRSKCKTMPEFMDYVTKWQEDQLEALQKRKKKPANMDAMIENIQDRASCMMMIASECSDLKSMHGKLQMLFTDASEENLIILGTTHKLKGLERDTVWMLESTYKPGESVEEDNLYYVACTRAKRTLNVVKGKLRDKSPASS